jgi:capsular polysaccharide biosynthesis protein
MDLSVMLPVNERERNCMSYCVFNKPTIIDPLGRVCTLTECLNQVDCGGGRGGIEGGGRSTQHHGKVVVLTQFWGEGYFHFLLENLPRLFPVLDMVISDPRIKIHVPIGGGGSFIPYLLESLGIERHRLVTGNVEADVVVYPETVQCGSPKLVQLSALRSMLEFVGTRGICPQLAFSKRFILVVSREGGARNIVNQRELVDALIRNTNNIDVEVRVFRPQPLDKCSHHRDMQIFKNSLVVVAPHGAGLSNIILANPGMVVIEIQTSNINMCYMDIALRLGLRHFVIVDEKATHSTSLTADIPRILDIIKRSNL